MVEVLQNNRASVVPGRPGRRPARALRRLLRPARLDPQGDRSAGHRAQGTRRRRRRAADRAGLPLRDRLRRRHRPRRAHRHGRRRPPPHPALHHGPRAADPPRPDAVPLAPSALEASAQAGHDRRRIIIRVARLRSESIPRIRSCHASHRDLISHAKHRSRSASTHRALVPHISRPASAGTDRSVRGSQSAHPND